MHHFLNQPRIVLGSINDHQRMQIKTALKKHPHLTEFLAEPLMQTGSPATFEIGTSYRHILGAVTHGYRACSQLNQIRLRGGFLRYALTPWFENCYKMYNTDTPSSQLPSLPPDIDFLIDATDTSLETIQEKIEICIFSPLALQLAARKPHLFDCYFALATVCCWSQRSVISDGGGYTLTSLECKNSPNIEFVILYRELARHSLSSLDKLSLCLTTNLLYCNNKVADTASIVAIATDNIKKRLVIENPETLDNGGLARVLSHEVSGTHLEDLNTFKIIYDNNALRAQQLKKCHVKAMCEMVERCCKNHLGASKTHLSAMFWNLYAFTNFSELKYCDKALEHQSHLSFQKNASIAVIQNWLVEELIKSNSSIEVQWMDRWIRIRENNVYWYLPSFVLNESQVILLLCHARDKVPRKLFETSFSPTFDFDLPPPVSLIREPVRRWHVHASHLFDALEPKEKAGMAVKMIQHGHPQGIDWLIRIYEIANPGVDSYFRLLGKVREYTNNAGTTPTAQIDHIAELTAGLPTYTESENKPLHACNWLLERTSQENVWRIYKNLSDRGYPVTAGILRSRFDFTRMSAAEMISNPVFALTDAANRLTLLEKTLPADKSAEELFYEAYRLNLIDAAGATKLFGKLKSLPSASSAHTLLSVEQRAKLVECFPLSNLSASELMNHPMIRVATPAQRIDLLYAALSAEGWVSIDHLFHKAVVTGIIDRTEAKVLFPKLISRFSFTIIGWFEDFLDSDDIESFKQLPMRVCHSLAATTPMTLDRVKHLLENHIGDPLDLHHSLSLHFDLIEKNLSQLAEPLTWLIIHLCQNKFYAQASLWSSLFNKSKNAFPPKIRALLSETIDAATGLDVFKHPIVSSLSNAQRVKHYVRACTSVSEQSADEVFSSAFKNELLPGDNAQSVFEELIPHFTFADPASICSIFPHTFPISIFKKLPVHALYAVCAHARVSTEHLQHLLQFASYQPKMLHDVLVRNIHLIEGNHKIILDGILKLQFDLLAIEETESAMIWLRLISKKKGIIADNVRSDLAKAYRLSSLNGLDVLEHPLLKFMKSAERAECIANAARNDTEADTLMQKTIASGLLNPDSLKSLFTELSPAFAFAETEWIRSLFKNSSIPIDTFKKYSSAKAQILAVCTSIRIEHLQHCIACHSGSALELHAFLLSQMVLVKKNIEVLAADLIGLVKRLADDNRIEEAFTWYKLLAGLTSDEHRQHLLASIDFSSMSIDELLDHPLFHMVEIENRFHHLREGIKRDPTANVDDIVTRALSRKFITGESARELFVVLVDRFVFDDVSWMLNVFDLKNPIPADVFRKIPLKSARVISKQVHMTTANLADLLKHCAVDPLELHLALLPHKNRIEDSLDEFLPHLIDFTSHLYKHKHTSEALVWARMLLKKKTHIPQKACGSFFDNFSANGHFVEASELATVVPNIPLDSLRPIFKDARVPASTKIEIVDFYQINDFEIWKMLVNSKTAGIGRSVVRALPGAAGASFAVEILHTNLAKLKSWSSKNPSSHPLANDFAGLFEDCVCIIKTYPSNVSRTHLESLLAYASNYFCVSKNPDEIGFTCYDIYVNTPDLLRNLIFCLAQVHQPTAVHEICLQLLLKTKETDYFYGLGAKVIEKAAEWKEQIQLDPFLLPIVHALSNSREDDAIFILMQHFMRIQSPRVHALCGVTLARICYGEPTRMLAWAGWIEQWAARHVTDYPIETMGIRDAQLLFAVLRNLSIHQNNATANRQRLIPVLCHAVRKHVERGYLPPSQLLVCIALDFVTQHNKCALKSPKYVREIAPAATDLLVSLLENNCYAEFTSRYDLFFNQALFLPRTRDDSIEHIVPTMESAHSFHRFYFSVCKKPEKLILTSIQPLDEITKVVITTQDVAEIRKQEAALKAYFLDRMIIALQQLSDKEKFIEIYDIIGKFLTILVSEYPEQNRAYAPVVHKYVFARTPPHLPALGKIRKTKSREFFEENKKSICFEGFEHLEMEIYFNLYHTLYPYKSYEENLSVVRHMLLRNVDSPDAFCIAEALQNFLHLKAEPDIPGSLDFRHKFLGAVVTAMNSQLCPFFEDEHILYVNLVNCFMKLKLYNEDMTATTNTVKNLVAGGIQQINLFHGQSVHPEIFSVISTHICKHYFVLIMNEDTPLFNSYRDYYFQTLQLLTDQTHNHNLPVENWIAFAALLNIENPEDNSLTPDLKTLRIEIFDKILGIITPRATSTELEKVRELILTDC
jgi:hypothetical protein